MKYEFITLDGEHITVDFTVRNYCPTRKKRNAMCIGINVKSMMDVYRFTDEDKTIIKERLETIASRWGLIKEFRRLEII